MYKKQRGIKMEIKKNINIKISKDNKIEIGLLVFGIAILGYMLYLLSLFLIKTDSNYNFFIILLSWIGIFILGYIVLTWYKITGYVFSPYVIFIVFFFLFNYGQPLMWSVGIHIPSEIGQKPLYPGLDIASEGDIFKAQALVLSCILMFHFGAVVSYIICRKKTLHLNQNSLQLNKHGGEDRITLNVMYWVCLFIALIAVPITLYYSFKDLQIARNYGYKALYYSEHTRTGASVFSIFLFMFFPCLIGLLIGSRFSKKVRWLVYAIFFIYLTFNLLSGDRSSWVFKLIILIWMSHTSYKPLNFKKIVKYIPLIIIGLYFLNAIVSLRNVGISFNKVIESLKLVNSPIISAFFEMGGSMKTIIVLQKYGWDIWPYTNTYVLALLGMVTNRVFDFLSIPFTLLSNFFSENYLGISWGAGFSIISEALLNFGPIFTPLFMIVLGYIFSSMLSVDKNMNYKHDSLKFFFVVSTLDALIAINRNVIHIPLKTWFYGVLQPYIIILLIRNFRIRKNCDSS